MDVDGDGDGGGDCVDGDGGSPKMRATRASTRPSGLAR